MITIHLFPDLNKVHVSESLDGEKEATELFVHQFSRRWECHLLCMLIDEAQRGRTVTNGALQTVLRKNGQQNDLNRAQLQRLLNGLSDFFLKLPQLQISLDVAPRQYTVGPWKLIYPEGISFINQKIENEKLKKKKRPWTHPRLLVARSHLNIDKSSRELKSLHEILSVLLTSDAFAVNGEYADAIHIQLNLDPKIFSDEFANVLKLREAIWQKKIGNFEVAKQLAGAVAQQPLITDVGLVANAQFLLSRISYDESPSKAHKDLWQNMPSPQPMMSSDQRLLPEWHNLRALLTRRRLIEIGLTNDGQAINLHFEALDHLQSSIYWALQFRDWDRMQAYVANISFHLQSVLPLGLVTINEVFMWHRLCLAYGDKLSLSQDSGWEYIFLGKFWLEHHAEIAVESAADPLAHTVEDAHPSQVKFYSKAIAKLTTCADARQLGIMWLLYSRFAVEHLEQTQPSTESVSSEISMALGDLFAKNLQLKQTLAAEGYSSYLTAF